MIFKREHIRQKLYAQEKHLHQIHITQKYIHTLEDTLHVNFMFVSVVQMSPKGPL